MTLTPRAQDPVLGLVGFDQALDAPARSRVRDLAALEVVEVSHAEAAGHVVAGISVPVGFAEGAEVVLATEVVGLFAVRDLVVVVEAAFELDGELHRDGREGFFVVHVVCFHHVPDQAEEVVEEDFVFVVEEEDVEDAFDAGGHLVVVGVGGGPGEDDGLLVGGVVHQGVLTGCHHCESALAVAVHGIEAMLVGDSWTIAPEMGRHRIVINDALYYEFICAALFPMTVEIIYHVSNRAVAGIRHRSTAHTKDSVGIPVHNLLLALRVTTVKMLAIMSPDWLTGY